MDLVLRFVHDRAAELEGHPLFSWLRHADVPPARRLAVLPALAPFALGGYPDICTWALPYPAPHAGLEAAINRHATGTDTRCQAFLADWAALELDNDLDWPASETIWWLFLAPETAATRRAGTQMLTMPADDGGDPLLRYSWAAAIEACWALFFRAAAPLARELSERTGRPYRYLSSPCPAEDRGRGQDMAMFAAQKLSHCKRARALALASRICDLFEPIFDSILDYGTAYPAAAQTPHRSPGPPLASRPRSLPQRPVDAGSANRPALALLGERRRYTERHRAYRWLMAPPPPDAATKLATLAPEWVPAVLGYGELLHVVCGEAAPGRAAITLAKWTGDLARCAAVFMDDWCALDLDQRLGWTAGQTLDWLYRSPHTAVARQKMAALAELAASCRSPLVRLWLLAAVEASNEPWFTATGRLAQAAERDLAAPVDYLAGRCRALAPDRGRFRQVCLAQPDLAQVLEVIRAVFDATDRQLDRTPAWA